MTTPQFLAEIPDPWAADPDPRPEAIHMALLDRLADGWDIEEGSPLYIETRIDALAITLIWVFNERLSKQLNPLDMLDLLPQWEKAANLRPNANDDTSQRRRALAARLRGVVGNALADIGGVAQQIAGDAYVGLTTGGTAYVFWPGVNPGPPGQEFSSSAAIVAVVLDRSSLTDPEWLAIKSGIEVQLDDMRPSWLLVEVGGGTALDSGFVSGDGIVGETLIGS